MAKLHFFDFMKLSEVDRAPGSFLKKHILSQFMRNYQHNTGNKKNIMAVLSMPYSVFRGDFWMTNNDYNHHNGVHIFNVLLVSPLLSLSYPQMR